MELTLVSRLTGSTGLAVLACVLLLACTKGSLPSPESDAAQADLIVNYATPDEGPIVVLNDKLLYATERDSLLGALRGVVLDSIRVYPAGAATERLFGSKASQGVVVIATRGGS